MTRDDVRLLSKLGAPKNLLVKVDVLTILAGASDRPVSTEVLRQRLAYCGSIRSLQRSMQSMCSMGLCKRKAAGWTIGDRAG